MTHCHYKSWPFEEAKRLVNRFLINPPAKGYALFQTGYGPSGLPHIGTFAEVLRTTMVRKAFEQISDIPTQFFSFSDDMDGLRKVPDNVPNQELLRQHLNKPLTEVPDPFGIYESFGHHNNAMLRRFLDSFGFSYEFKSATQCYKSGFFDPYLKMVLSHYDEIMAIMLPSLRDERRKTYSPFLPICPTTGHVLQVPIKEVRIEDNTIIYEDPRTSRLVEVLVTGGHCKLQWKVDWGMRWRAFSVDYEMSGKDLIDSVKLSSQICRVINGRTPENFTYELFLDDKGQKISKSKGNGIGIDEWLSYAPQESLAYYMFQSPKKAKRLYFDVIPKACDEYLAHLDRFVTLTPQQQTDDLIWHIHHDEVSGRENPLSFTILLNLASICNTQDPQVLWGFVKRYLPNADESTMPFTNQLISLAIRYFTVFVKPKKIYRSPTSIEADALRDLHDQLIKFYDTQCEGHHEDTFLEAVQTIVYSVGKSYSFPDLRAWFKTLYEVLFGQVEGPRIGSFIELYGIPEFCALIQERLDKK